MNNMAADAVSIREHLTDEFINLLYDPFLETIANRRTRAEYRRCIDRIMLYFYNKRKMRYSFELLDEQDAKDYFLMLRQKGADGQITFEYFSQQLSICRSFASFLEAQFPLIEKHDEWYGAYSYKNAFDKVVFPRQEFLVHTRNIVHEDQIDKALSYAKEHDMQLFLILALSLRMMLTQSVILGLKKEDVTFSDDPSYHGTVCVVSYIYQKQQQFKRVPSDLIRYFQPFVENRPSEGFLFLNKYGNQMSPKNLSAALDKMGKALGFALRPSQFRQRGIADLVVQNPDAIDEVEKYTGLSKRMLGGYSEAFDRLQGGCIADRSGYKILYVGKEKQGEDV